MDNTTELQRLEQFVDKLLNKYNQLKADYLAPAETCGNATPSAPI